MAEPYQLLTDEVRLDESSKEAWSWRSALQKEVERGTMRYKVHLRI